MSSITSNQLEYIKSLEWDCDYWDNLSIEVLDALDSDVRELCFEYYDSLVEDCNALVRDDVKLDEVIEPVEVTPQEVVSEPQEDIVSSTTTNEDLNMNNSTIIPSWEVSGYVNLVDLDFSTAITYAYVPEVIPDFWEGDAVETAVVNNLVIKPVVQLCLPAGKEAVESESTVEPQPLTDELADVRASVARVCNKMERRSAYGSPARYNTTTITTKSGKVVQVSPHCTAPHGGASVSNRITNSKVTGSIGEAEAIDVVKAKTNTQLNIFQAPTQTIRVTNCKAELLDAECFEDIITTTRKYNAIDKSIVLDAKSKMTKRELGYIEGLKKAYTIIKDSETVKAKAIPTPTVTHNAMMSTIRRMNGGRIPNAPVLNKLVTGYVTRNNAIVASVSKYIAPTLLEIVEKAYAQLTA